MLVCPKLERLDTPEVDAILPDLVETDLAVLAAVLIAKRGTPEIPF